MTLKDQMAEDAKNVFMNTDEFAELVNYTPYGGTSKTIKAIVFRERVDAGVQDRGRTSTYRAEIQIANDSTAGVTSVNKGKDSVQFPVYIGGSAVEWGVIDIISHDEGIWRLQVER